MFTDTKDSKELIPAIAAATVCIGFLLYYYLTNRRLTLRLLEKIIPRYISFESFKFIFGKVTGLVLFGLIPFILLKYILRLPHRDMGLTLPDTSEYIYLLVLLLIIAIILPFLLSRNRTNRLFSPELKVRVWKLRHFILAASGWLIYLLGYEFIFRGILWSICYNAYGFGIALGINIFLYSAVHIPKGKLVTLGAIPVGALFCFMTYISGSFLPAFIIHSAMAISGELFSAYSGQAFNHNSAILRG